MYGNYKKPWIDVPDFPLNLGFRLRLRVLCVLYNGIYEAHCSMSEEIYLFTYYEYVCGFYEFTCPFSIFYTFL